ncbi:hypothetical protein HDV05_001056 [Chytridiales sp. JEL 0842]|nr:hypothetical protein HDV05_001056 [Chytridiales sp. JEL 0842]
MFKKRPQRQYRKKSDSDNDDSEDAQRSAKVVPATNGSDADEVANGSGEERGTALSIEELIELRKLRQTKRGIDAEELIKGDSKLKKKTAEPPEDPWKLKTGGLVDLDAVKGSKMVFGEEPKVGGAGFASATNVMDTERKMQEFIEKELAKRKGQLQEKEDGVSPTSGVVGPVDDLFDIPENLQTAAKPIKESNVTLSAAMLTAIPEVDLGIE